MQQPEAYVGGAAKLFDDKGALTDSSTREFVQKFLQALKTKLEFVFQDLGKPVFTAGRTAICMLCST